MMGESCNGWANWQTWHVSLWLQNDEGLYNIMREHAGDGMDYRQLAVHLHELQPQGVDGVSWLDAELDHGELNKMMRESIDDEEEDDDDDEPGIIHTGYSEREQFTPWEPTSDWG
jgi:hypothetical protein